MNIESDGSSVVTYAYHPSESAGWAFVALFAGSTVAHIVLMFPYRSAFFIPMIIGGISSFTPPDPPDHAQLLIVLTHHLVESGGYYGRVWSSHDPSNFKAYILQVLLILAAPPIISATIYMALSRIIKALDAAHHAIVSPRWTTALFMLGDIVAFCSQLAGAGMQATTSASVRKTGGTVVTVGLFFHLALFSFFIVNTIVFHVRNSRNPSYLSGHPRVPNWRRRMYALYLASAFIQVRNIVRIAEYIQGADGFVMSHEVFIYLFDAALMWLAITIFVVVHPGKLIKKAKRAEKDMSSSGDGLLAMEARGGTKESEMS